METFIVLILFIIVLILLYSIFPTIYFKIKRAFLNYEKQKTKITEKLIYLTFDDGPSRDYTEKLLCLLKKYNIKVTFFMVAKYALENPDIVEKIKKEGHMIGLHSLEHKRALWRSPFYTNKDFKESISIMKRLDTDIEYYRPPWGYFNLMTIQNIKKYNLNLVLWDVMAQDWRGDTTPDEIKNKLIKRTKNRNIICLHDGRGKNSAPARTIEALEKTIPMWIDEGYKFLKVGEVYE